MREGRELGPYEIGRTAFLASRADPRCSYCLYVPRDYDESESRPYPLVVVVHGTLRLAETYRDRFADLAEREDAIVLAPLFPGGIGVPHDLENYKRLRAHGVSFDEVLLGIVDEVGERYRVDPEQFLLFGFSGGAHFAHRFFYVHPQRLAAVSIAAPGVVTLLDERRDWWIGIRDLERHFGHAADLDAMRRVAVQMIVGAEDVETWEITVEPGDPMWMEGINDSGVTRIDRLAALRDSFERAGIGVAHEVVPGVAHSGPELMERAKAFFTDVLAKRRER